MEAPKIEPPKLPDMVMCGDHPSVTKTELNAKEERPEDHDKPKDKAPMSYARISPTGFVCPVVEARRASYSKVWLQPSRTERLAADRSRTLSEHALEARRRARSLEIVTGQHDATPDVNRALVHAALGTFRWPPYLVAVWVIVLLLTHLLHCIVSMLERALPTLKGWCEWWRRRAQRAWRAGGGRARVAGAAGATGAAAALYALYAGLCAARAAALWAVRAPGPQRGGGGEDLETRLTDYADAPADGAAHKD